jgi:hypothetical protein
MAGTTNTGALQDAIRQSWRIQIITIIWMGAEAANALVQNDPDQVTEAMRNGSDGFVVS